MPQIDIQPDEKIFEIGRNETVLYASLYAGIPHTHACGGQARCSTCRILILEGIEHCDRRTIPELLLAQKLGFTANIRLACQTKVRADIKIKRLVQDW
jgi:adenylate cyclase